MLIPIVKETKKLSCSHQVKRCNRSTSSDASSQDDNLIDYTASTNPKLRVAITARRHQENKETTDDSTTSAYVRKFFPSHTHTRSDTSLLGKTSKGENMSQRTVSFSYSLADSLISTSRSVDDDSSLLFCNTLDGNDDEDSMEEKNQIHLLCTDD
jgi:hypothetical protein